MVIDDELAAPGAAALKILDFRIAKVLWGGLPEVLELEAERPLRAPRPCPRSAPSCGTDGADGGDEAPSTPRAPSAGRETASASPASDALGCSGVGAEGGSPGGERPVRVSTRS